MDLNEMTGRFQEIFGTGTTPEIYFAPGRVNLIGEHTDYNKGCVLPCALSFGTWLAFRETREPYFECCSEGFAEFARIPLAPQYSPTGRSWTNYPLGIIEMFRQSGFTFGGLQLYFYGDIPAAAGLSSSASIEMVTAFALNDHFGWNLNLHDLIMLTKKAENEFVGVNCGIMDMFAVGLGKEGHAIFLDCGTLDYRLVPFSLPGYSLVIMNTNKHRELGDSKYNERVAECQAAIHQLKAFTDLDSLSMVGPELLHSLRHIFADPTVYHRAWHVVTENERVRMAVSALDRADHHTFGKLMSDSHVSLRDHYEVTGRELDIMVDLALRQEGVLGARMTGAGFGGCAIALVKENLVSQFINSVAEGYGKKTGLQADLYTPWIGDGVKKVNP